MSVRACASCVRRVSCGAVDSCGPTLILMAVGGPSSLDIPPFLPCPCALSFYSWLLSYVEHPWPEGGTEITLPSHKYRNATSPSRRQSLPSAQRSIITRPFSDRFPPGTASPLLCTVSLCGIRYKVFVRRRTANVHAWKDDCVHVAYNAAVAHSYRRRAPCTGAYSSFGGSLPYAADVTPACGDVNHGVDRADATTAAVTILDLRCQTYPQVDGLQR
ncbi:hypothetical protein JB92DRAFT_1675682 [Gautieria morchelliformis]|nr:hypothetical protein JB92DRAFT_1675682 [Gautieria morchelliformis]